MHSCISLSKSLFCIHKRNLCSTRVLYLVLWPVLSLESRPRFLNWEATCEIFKGACGLWNIALLKYINKICQNMHFEKVDLRKLNSKKVLTKKEEQWLLLALSRRRHPKNFKNPSFRHPI